MADEPGQVGTLSKDDQEIIRKVVDCELKQIQSPYDWTTSNQFYLFSVVTVTIMFGFVAFGAVNRLEDWIVQSFLAIGSVLAAFFIFAGFARSFPGALKKTFSRAGSEGDSAKTPENQT